MMASCTPFNKLIFGAGGPPSESQSEISSVDSDWSDIRAIALQLGVPNPDDLLTERFKVDRQKLENMIKTDSSTEGVNSAEQFFDNVMKNTTTYIGWPCRLKIGAKTKKDPHVRIVGKPENVLCAKERVLATLDSRGTRVIMKMDVSYTDHSYIIGRGGNNIKRIMEQTTTHIHFPDSNRSNPTEKSNQVSLCGSLDGVERARSLVRSSTPLLMSFELPIVAPGRPVPDNETPYIKEVEAKYNVQVIFSTRPKLHTSLVLVKGSENEAKKVQEATQLLINYTCENIASQILVQMQLEISPQHHDIVRGKNNVSHLNIMERTKTKIIFPDVNDLNVKPIKRSQVTITGTIDGVYRARQQLIGNLPIALIFDYPESTADPNEIASLSNKHGVFISLRQKQRQSTMAVVIKGVEKFIDKVYEARHEVLKLKTPLVKPDIPATYFSMKDTDLELAYRRSLTSLLSNYPESPLTPGFPVFPANAFPSGFPSVFQKFQQNAPPGLSGVNPKFLQPLHGMGGYHANHQNTSSCPSGGNNSGSNSANNNNFLAVPSPHVPQTLSPRNNTSSNTSGYQSYNSSTNSLEQNFIPSITTGYCSPDTTFGSEGKGRRMSDGAMQAGRMIGGNDYMTPHHDSKNQPRAFDFDMKRVDGFKAMERHPHGELRTPNANWMGLGLSRTSPGIIETDNDVPWHRPPSTQYNMRATTGLIDGATLGRRIDMAQHKDIHSLLTNLGLEHYIKTFVVNEIDLDMFASLTEDNLIELGITAFGARKKLLMAIHTLAATLATNPSMQANKSGRFSGSAAPGAERRVSSGW